MAAQPGGSAFTDAAAVPLADGRADDRPGEIRQTGGTAEIYGMTLCKTEKLGAVLPLSGDTVFRRYTARHMRLKDGSGG